MEHPGLIIDNGMFYGTPLVVLLITVCFMGNHGLIIDNSMFMGQPGLIVDNGMFSGTP